MGNVSPQCCSDPQRGGKASGKDARNMLPARSDSSLSEPRPNVDPITPREERGRKKDKDPSEGSHATCGPNKDRTQLFLACGHT